MTFAEDYGASLRVYLLLLIHLFIPFRFIPFHFISFLYRPFSAKALFWVVCKQVKQNYSQQTKNENPDNKNVVETTRKATAQPILNRKIRSKREVGSSARVGMEVLPEEQRFLLPPE